MTIIIENNRLLDVETLSDLMIDSSAAGPGTGAGRRPRSPGSSFRLIRVQHEAAGQIALSVLTTMSLVPEFHVMLQQNGEKTFKAVLSGNISRGTGQQRVARVSRGSQGRRGNTGRRFRAKWALIHLRPRLQVLALQWVTFVGSSVGVIPLSVGPDKV